MNINKNVAWEKRHFINMKLLANLFFRAFSTIKNFTQFYLYKCFVVEACQIFDFLPFSGYFTAAQVFHFQVLITKFQMGFPMGSIIWSYLMHFLSPSLNK